MNSKVTPLNADPDALLNEEGAARFLGVSIRFLQKHRCQGDGPVFCKLSSRCIRYRRRDLATYAEAHTKTSTAA